jgi:hypothetical protein
MLLLKIKGCVLKIKLPDAMERPNEDSELT